MQINGLGSIHGPHAVQGTQRTQAAQQPQAPSSATVQGVDQLDISPEAQRLSQIRDVPDIRADRVAEIKAAIEAGVYETEEKLSIAVDRLFDEFA